MKLISRWFKTTIFLILVLATACSNSPSTIKIMPGKGPLYKTVFSIANQKNSSMIPFAAAQDNFFLVENSSRKILVLDSTGRGLGAIDLTSLNISQVADIQATETGLVLLEAADLSTTPNTYRIDRVTFDGQLLSQTPIPVDFPPDINLDLANYIQAVLLDCGDNIYLEMAGTSALYSLADFQQQKPLVNGMMCRDKRYHLDFASPGNPRFTAGDQTYKTKGSGQFVSLRLLHVFADGSFLLGRQDVMNGSPIQVDWTIHYINAAGDEAGVARVPLSEFFSTQGQKISVGRDGQVYLILPREKASDIIRLHFFQQLGPLAPGAAAPIIERIKP